MAYCNVADIKAIKAVTNLTDASDNGNWSDTDITALTVRISDGEIDPRLQKLYTTLPISPTPDVLKEICILKVVYEMLQQEFGSNEEQYTYFRDRAERLMTQILDNSINLTPNDDDTPTTGVGAIVFGDDDNRFFKREDM